MTTDEGLSPTLGGGPVEWPHVARHRDVKFMMPEDQRKFNDALAQYERSRARIDELSRQMTESAILRARRDEEWMRQ